MQEKYNKNVWVQDENQTHVSTVQKVWSIQTPKLDGDWRTELVCAIDCTIGRLRIKGHHHKQFAQSTVIASKYSAYNKCFSSII